MDTFHAVVLNMQRYICNNIIIIVANVNFIILEFLSARFVHPGAPQLNSLSFFKKARITKLLINPFFLTTMMSELPEYLNEQLGVFLNVKQLFCIV